MKLHLPKALFAAVVAACGAIATAYADGGATTVTNSTDLTYTGTIYTLGTTGGNVLSNSVYETTLSPGEGDAAASWNVSADAITTNQNNKWAALYATGTINSVAYSSYNTLRVTNKGDYVYAFNALSLAGIIVESGIDGAAFKSTGTANRSIYIGKNGISGNSYFGSSFTFDNTSSTNAEVVTKIDGTQTWTIAEGKTVTLKTGNVDISGNFTLTGKGILDISSATNLNLKSSISNQENEVKLGNVTINLNKDAIILGSIARDLVLENGGVDGNGYVTSASAKVFSNADKVTSSGNISYQLNGIAVNAENVSNYVVNWDSSAEGIYLIAKDEAYNSSSMSDAKKIAVLGGATLTLNESLADTVTQGIIARNGSTVSLASGVTLNNSSVSSAYGTATLKGSGTYNMGSSTTANVAGLTASTWTGKVLFENTSINDLKLDELGNEKSSIEIKGWNGYFFQSHASVSNADIVLTNGTDGYAVNIANGYSDITISGQKYSSKYTFSGNVSGSGVWQMNKPNASAISQHYVFAGDVSGWTGKFHQKTGNHNTTLDFTGSNEVKAAMVNDAGTLNVNIDNDSAVSMTGDVTADGGVLNLTKTGGSKLTVNNLAANGGNVVLTGTGDNAIEVGTLSVASGKTVTGTADVTVTGKLDANRTEGVALTGALTLKDGVTVDVTDLLQANTYTYNLASATNGVTVGTYSVTGLGDAYSSYQGRVSAVDPNTAAGVATAAEGNSNTNLVLTLELVKLTVTGATGYADGVLTLTTAEKATGAIFGESLAASVSDDIWAQITKNYTLGEKYAVTFVDADGAIFDFDGTDGSAEAPTITFMGETATELTVNGTVVGNFTGAVVPEPTTATLSLLALAALAARRRRK